jgi:hypothetical protein
MFLETQYEGKCLIGVETIVSQYLTEISNCTVEINYRAINGGWRI